MDYRKFLGRTEELVLPYFGGLSVHAEGRRLRLSDRMERGFYRFEVRGRNATVLGKATAPDLSRYPRVRGHFAAGYVFESGKSSWFVEFLEESAPAELTPLVARQLPGGYVLFETADFETEAEDAARRALEEERALTDIAHVGASLRSAYALALATRVGRSLSVPVGPREVAGKALTLAQGGREAATALLHEISLRRAQERTRLGNRLEAASLPRVYTDERTLFGRLSDVLERAGATLLDARMTEHRIEVTWRMLGERLISLVEVDSLRVIDAGFCLSGEDDLVTLASLPSVLKEAVHTDQLNITRW